MPRQVPRSELRRPPAPAPPPHPPHRHPPYPQYGGPYGGGEPGHPYPHGHPPPQQHHHYHARGPPPPPQQYPGGGRSLSNLADAAGGNTPRGGTFPLPPNPTQQHHHQPPHQPPPQQGPESPEERAVTADDFHPLDNGDPQAGRRYPARARKARDSGAGHAHEAAAESVKDGPSKEGPSNAHSGAKRKRDSSDGPDGAQGEQEGKAAFVPPPTHHYYQYTHQPHPPAPEAPYGFQQPGMGSSESGSWEQQHGGGDPRYGYPPYPPHYYQPYPMDPRYGYPPPQPYPGPSPAHGRQEARPGYHDHPPPAAGYQEFMPPADEGKRAGYSQNYHTFGPGAPAGAPPPGPEGAPPLPPPAVGPHAMESKRGPYDYGPAPPLPRGAPPPGHGPPPPLHPYPAPTANAPTAPMTNAPTTAPAPPPMANAPPPAMAPPMASALPPRRRSTPTATAVEGYHLPRPKARAPYRYTTAHKSKSWDEMMDLFRGFVEREGHGDVERDDPWMNEGDEDVGGKHGEDGAKNDANDDTAAVGGGKKGNDNSKENGDDNAGSGIQLDASASSHDDDDDLLTLRSWVREVRWVVRAEGHGQDDKLPQRLTKPSHAQRCDAENVTLERWRELESMPTFPLHRPGEKGNRSAFQRWIDDLMHYRAKHGGDCNVPLKYAEYPGLGNFVNRQRTEYRKLQQGRASSMTQSKVRELDRAGFTWSVREGGHASWDSRLRELTEYQRTHGHTNVPKSYPPNPSLGYWVNEQRFQYRRLTKGKGSYMTPEKISRLDALGFKWVLRETKRPWHEWMEELRRYKAEFGHCDVPLKYRPNVPLGSFVNNQRSEYRRYRLKKGTTSMTEEKVRELEGMGFRWNVRETRTPWKDRLEELREYKKRHGDCNVPNNWPENQPLSYWVAKQRQQYRLYGRGKGCGLTKERVDQLDELGFDWRLPTAIVPKGFANPIPGGVVGGSTRGGAEAVTVDAPAAVVV